MADPRTYPFPSQATGLAPLDLSRALPYLRKVYGLFTAGIVAAIAGGLLALYGPYRRNGAHTADSNAAFDALSSKSSPPSWSECFPFVQTAISRNA